MYTSSSGNRQNLVAHDSMCWPTSTLSNAKHTCSRHCLAQGDAHECWIMLTLAILAHLRALGCQVRVHNTQSLRAHRAQTLRSSSGVTVGAVAFSLLVMAPSNNPCADHMPSISSSLDSCAFCHLHQQGRSPDAAQQRKGVHAPWCNNKADFWTQGMQLYQDTCSWHAHLIAQKRAQIDAGLDPHLLIPRRLQVVTALQSRLLTPHKEHAGHMPGMLHSH